MGLCDLCSNIPWETLPPVPIDVQIWDRERQYIHEFLFWPSDQQGYSHHQSAEALRSSGTDLHCGLCYLISKQVELCRTKLCKARLEDLKSSYEAPNKLKFGWPLWKFWLTKRPNGYGFWGFSPTDSRFGDAAMLVAAIALCVRDDDPLATIIPGRPVELHSGSATAMLRVSRWLDQCVEHQCYPGDSWLPTRVIDAGKGNASVEVRLRETGGVELAKYIALSYCWGKSPQFITTKATLEDRKSRIAIADLPKTHQDAIMLTRYLGVRYLWIDSMCTCQDDYEDWEREAARMLSVYTNAYLTIIASKADDSGVGLFSELPFREYFRFEHTSSGIDGHVLAYSAPLEECEPTLYISLPDEPVSQRGWAFQELVLSHRSLIYTKDQMAFECAEGFRTEDGWISEERYHTVTQTETGREMKGEGANTDKTMYRNEREMLLRSWYSLISLYGIRKLTKASDKLPAMSGLASVWSKVLDDEYVAGHWRSSLVYQLPWSPRHCRRVKEYRAPSWSWASVDGAPTLRIRHGCDTLADILDINIKRNGSNPYGEITEGKLVIRAPMQQLDVSIHDCGHGQPRLSFQDQPIRHTPVMDTDLSYKHDFDKLPGDIREEEKRFLQSLGGAELYALVLVCGPLPGQKTVFYEALLVAKDKGCEEFTRKGILTLNDGMMGWKPEGQAKDECPTITLI